MKSLFTIIAILTVSIFTAQETYNLDKIHTQKRIHEIVGHSVVYAPNGDYKVNEKLSIIELEGDFVVLGGEYVVMKKDMQRFKKNTIITIKTAMKYNYSTTKYRTCELEKVQNKETGEVLYIKKGLVKKFAFTIDGSFNHDYAGA